MDLRKNCKMIVKGRLQSYVPLACYFGRQSSNIKWQHANARDDHQPIRGKWSPVGLCLPPNQLITVPSKPWNCPTHDILHLCYECSHHKGVTKRAIQEWDTSIEPRNHYLCMKCVREILPSTICRSIIEDFWECAHERWILWYYLKNSFTTTQTRIWVRWIL